MRVSVRDVSARYGRKLALDRVSFEVESGSVFALLGRNGAGKSTMARILLGELRPSSGSVSIDGLDPWRSRSQLMARVGATPEAPDAPQDLRLDAIEQFTAPLFSSWDRGRFRSRLERFGISLRARFGELSRGQKGLVQLALALAHTPELLVLDDPTLGLDPVARRFVFDELIGELADREATVLLTSHDLDGVERVATHIGILADARLFDCGDLETLRANAVAAGVEAPTLEEIFLDRVGKEPHS